MPDFLVRQRDVRVKFLSLDVRKASGANILKNMLSELSFILTRFYSVLYSSGISPPSWKVVQPVSKTIKTPPIIVLLL